MVDTPQSQQPPALVSHRGWAATVHAFDACTRDRSSGLSAVRLRTGPPSLGRGKNSLAVWLLCLSGLQLEPNICLWVFIIRATSMGPRDQPRSPAWQQAPFPDGSPHQSCLVFESGSHVGQAHLKISV